MIDAMTNRDVEAMVALNHEHRSHAIEPVHRILGAEAAEVQA
jgi:hypothetical protein